MELVLGLDLRRSQRHRRAMTNDMKGDPLDAGQDIMVASIDEGAPGIDGRRSHIRCQLEGLQLHRQGWRSQKQKSYRDKKSGNQNKGVLGVDLTYHHGIGFG